MASARLYAAALLLAASALSAGTPALAAPVPHAFRPNTCPVADLEALKSRLDSIAADGHAGKAQYWYVDPDACKVKVTVLQGWTDAATRDFVTTAKTSGLIAVQGADAPVGTRVGFQHGPASLHAGARHKAADTLPGGTEIDSPISGGYIRCTTGFNVSPDTTTTAGHCAKTASTWYVRGASDLLGPVSASDYPGADWAKISPTSSSWSLSQSVLANDTAQAITGYHAASNGERICETGASSGTQCGTVQATGVTVNYGDGPVGGLIYTNAPGSAGDSGGPAFDGTVGVGIVSGGGAANGQPPTFIQPMNF